VPVEIIVSSWVMWAEPVLPVERVWVMIELLGLKVYLTVPSEEVPVVSRILKLAPLPPLPCQLRPKLSHKPDVLA
jgi:hypothetical protein